MERRVVQVAPLPRMGQQVLLYRRLLLGRGLIGYERNYAAQAKMPPALLFYLQLSSRTSLLNQPILAFYAAGYDHGPLSIATADPSPVAPFTLSALFPDNTP